MRRQRHASSQLSWRSNASSAQTLFTSVDDMACDPAAKEKSEADEDL